MTIEYCDWCKEIVDNTCIYTHGSNWDIFEDICDDCSLKLLLLRRSITSEPPDFDVRGSRPASMEGYAAQNKRAEELKQEYIELKGIKE